MSNNANSSFLHQTLVVTLIVMGVIAVGAFFSGYAGDVLFNVGPNGINLELDGYPPDES